MGNFEASGSVEDIPPEQSSAYLPATGCRSSLRSMTLNDRLKDKCYFFSEVAKQCRGFLKARKSLVANKQRTDFYADRHWLDEPPNPHPKAAMLPLPTAGAFSQDDKPERHVSSRTSPPQKLFLRQHAGNVPAEPLIIGFGKCDNAHQPASQFSELPAAIPVIHVACCVAYCAASRPRNLATVSWYSCS